MSKFDDRITPCLEHVQEELISALIGLARAAGETHTYTAETSHLVIRALSATAVNANFNEASIQEFVRAVREEKMKYASDCALCQNPCGRKDDYALENLQDESEVIRSLKLLLLYGTCGIAENSLQASTLGYHDDEISEFIYKALCFVGMCDLEKEDLMQVLMEAGKVSMSCMELLDYANTKTFGSPIPERVTMEIEKGPFIVVSGHDMHALRVLLEQTREKGISVYTHGELISAHAYPLFKMYSHLKGNIGTSWRNQESELEQLLGPVLFTSNCLKPVKGEKAERFFTTGVANAPGMVHIGTDLDFSPVIQKAIDLGGYEERKRLYGINGGTELMTGFGQGTLLSILDMVVKAVKDKKIRHFFLIGGCDGAETGRCYYTDFVKELPEDIVILTLACGKYRFNDLDLGEVAGVIPRMMDLGQCNDSFSAIRIAIQLAEDMNCSVNDLPLTVFLSLHEQKSVSILLMFLYLGLKNIYIGPETPPFLSEEIIRHFEENTQICLIGNPQEDINRILKNARI